MSRYPSSEAIITLPSVATTIQTVPGGTTGDDTITTNLLKDFFVDILAGDDVITVEETASAFEIQARGGEDTITLKGDSSAALIKGGSEDDTFDFQAAVTTSSIYGGKGADSFDFDRTVTGGVVSGDTGADSITLRGKISGGALISGGAGDDLFTVNERITASTIDGGDARDTINILENSDTSAVLLGSDNDTLSITGKHSSFVGKGNGGDDSLTLEAALTGSGNKFYAGKGEDSVTIKSDAKVTVHGDKDDDLIKFTADSTSEGSSVYGGDGDDTLDASLAVSGSDLFIKGNSGDDEIKGATATTGKETIYGGIGDDTITGGSGGSYTYFGDGGDDTVTATSTKVSSFDGGEGDDAITILGVSADSKKRHTITGGAGIDTIKVEGTVTDTKANDYKPSTEASLLKYSSFKEFFSEGDIVDSINITTSGGAVQTAQALIAEIAEKLTFTSSDEFDRATVRDNPKEGLIIQTSSGVTAGSSVVLSAAAANNLFGIDLSAGTTGDSTIDASKETETNLGMLLKGGAGKNTIKGTAGEDVIFGGAKNDILDGGAASDRITAGAGKDSVVGGAGDDKFVFKANLTIQDTITGGAGTDTLTFVDSDSATTDLDLVTEVEVVNLTNTTTDAKITLKDSTVAASASLTVDADTLTTGKLTFDGAAELDGTVSVIGGAAADTITGSAGADTITGMEGADSLKGGSGIDAFAYTANTADFVGTNKDVIVDFTQGAGGDVLALSEAGFNVGAGGLVAGTTSVITAAAGVANLASNIVVDTLAAIQGVNQSAVRFAYDTTNNDWLFDADGNFSAGSVTFASSTNALTAAGLVAANVVITA